jgi:hypothetical protein
MRNTEIREKYTIYCRCSENLKSNMNIFWISVTGNKHGLDHIDVYINVLHARVSYVYSNLKKNGLTNTFFRASHATREPCFGHVRSVIYSKRWRGDANRIGEVMWLRTAWYSELLSRRLEDIKEYAMERDWRPVQALFYPEYEGSRFIRDVGTYLPFYTALHSRKP